MKKIYFFKYSCGVVSFCICFFCFSFESFGQNTPVAGDFRSISAGNWHDNTIWQIFDGASWQAASSTQIPNQNSAVFLEAGLTVTLLQNGECKNLFVNEKEDVTRLYIRTFDLLVYGKMTMYNGSVTDAGGISDPISGPPNDPANPVFLMNSDVGGSIKFVGDTDREIIKDSEFTANRRFAGWTIEFAFTNNASGTINETIRFGNLIVSSGNLKINDADRMFVDENGVASDINGSVIVKNGAVLQGSRGFWKSNIAPMESFTVEQGGKFLVTYIDHSLAAQTLNLNGTYSLIGNIDQNFSASDADGNTRAGSALVNAFSNIEINLSGQKYLQNDIVINDTLFIKGNAQANLNGYILSYGVGGSLEYAGSSAQTTSNAELPVSGGPFNVIVNNPAHVSLHASRMIEGNLTLSAGRFILGNNNFTIGENSLAVNGAFSADNMVLINGTGILQKEVFQASEFLFPIGEINTGVPVYTPINVNLTSGIFGANAVVGVSVTNTKHPNDNSAEDYLARYWTISGSDITAFEYSTEADYLDTDVNGQEEDISTFIYNAGVPSILSSPDITLNKILANNITIFGDITGSNLCDISNNSFLSVPATTVFCQESPNLTINGSTATGSGAISYSWELRIDGGPWGSVSGEALEDIALAPQNIAGNYDLRRITTSDICSYPSISQNFSFTILPGISGNSIVNDGAATVCEGAAPGLFVGTTPEGGNNTYTYTWQQRIGGGVWETTGVDSKNHLEGMLDQSGVYEYRRLVTSGPCTTPSESNVITVTVEPAVSNNAISTDVTAFCGSATAFTITGTIPTGGNGAYTYFWESRYNGGTWNSIGINDANYSEEILTAAGTYEYRRLVSSGSCVDPVASNTLSVTLTEAIAISGAVTDAINSNNDGSIIVVVTGGTMPYEFSWSNGAITQNLEDIPAGTYTLTVTDENGCMLSKDFIVGQITGLEEEKKTSKFVVYPNPINQEKLTIEVHLQRPSAVLISIFSNMGNIVLERKLYIKNEIKTLVDVSALPDGLYHVDLMIEGVRSTKKIIKSTK